MRVGEVQTVRHESALPAPSWVLLPVRLIGFAEDWVGWFFNLLLTLTVGAIPLMVDRGTWLGLSAPARAGWVAAAVGWLWLDVPYLVRMFAAALRHRHPMAWWAAHAQKPKVLPVRVLVAAWWLAHFSFGVVLLIAGHLQQRRHAPGAVMTPLEAFVMSTAFGFAANGYLIAAVCSLTSREPVRKAAWRMRGLVDLLLGLAAFAISAAGRG